MNASCWCPLGYSGRRGCDRRASHSVASGPAGVVRLAARTAHRWRDGSAPRGQYPGCAAAHPMGGCSGSAEGALWSSHETSHPRVDRGRPSSRRGDRPRTGRAVVPALLHWKGSIATAGALGVVLLLLESLPLVWRRRYPLVVMLVVLTASIIHVAIIPAGAPNEVAAGDPRRHVHHRRAPGPPDIAGPHGVGGHDHRGVVHRPGRSRRSPEPAPDGPDPVRRVARRRCGAHPAAVCAKPGRAGPARGEGARGTNKASGTRGTRTNCPGAPRHDRPPRERDGDPGGWWPERYRDAPQATRGRRSSRSRRPDGWR